METADNNQEQQISGHYSLWLIPGVATERPFAEAIDYLSERYSGPRFAPHITLLSGLQGPEEILVAKTSELAGEFNSFNIKATGLAMEPYYFRNFYLKLESSANFLLAYQRASKALSKNTSVEFVPHISLHYGTSSREECTSMGKEIHSQLPGNATIDRLYLVHIPLAVPNWRIISRHEMQPSG